MDQGATMDYIVFNFTTIESLTDENFAILRLHLPKLSSPPLSFLFHYTVTPIARQRRANYLFLIQIHILQSLSE